jgi:hypothetical protein
MLNEQPKKRILFSEGLTKEFDKVKSKEKSKAFAYTNLPCPQDFPGFVEQVYILRMLYSLLGAELPGGCVQLHLRRRIDGYKVLERADDAMQRGKWWEEILSIPICGGSVGEVHK